MVAGIYDYLTTGNASMAFTAKEAAMNSKNSAAGSPSNAKEGQSGGPKKKEKEQVRVPPVMP